MMELDAETGTTGHVEDSTRLDYSADIMYGGWTWTCDCEAKKKKIGSKSVRAKVAEKSSPTKF